jgi:hypothetical protein
VEGERSSAISGLFAFGGGICPGLSMSGMLQALSAKVNFSPDHIVFFQKTTRSGSLSISCSPVPRR